MVHVRNPQMNINTVLSLVNWGSLKLYLSVPMIQCHSRQRTCKKINLDYIIKENHVVENNLSQNF